MWPCVAPCLRRLNELVGVIGLSLHMLGYASVGGSMVAAGIWMLVPFRRQSRYWGGKAALRQARST